MKKFLLLVLALLCALPLSGCEGGYEYVSLELRGSYTDRYKGTSLNVYNWGEYISDGSYGLMNVNKEFEKLTGIKVNYTTFESNETMYSQLKSGGVSYDIVVPSDYMIERMIHEGMLRKLDFSVLSNYDLIAEDYKQLYFDEQEEYSVAFNVGMVGIIYNSKQIKSIEHSWKVLWDSRYKNMTLNFNNPRDAFMTAQILLGQDLNSTDSSDWDAAAQLLKKQKENLQSYVMDEVYGKMETGEAAIAPYYAGDYLTMYETNKDLAFFYPEEGTNIFVDSLCIPKSAQNYEQALLYINFLMEPQVALANAEYIGYASPNTAVINNEKYCYYGSEILYPKPEEIPQVQYYHDIDPEIRKYYEELWLDIKLY